MIADIKKRAKQYPGSYELGVSGRTKVNGKVVTFVAYTNPQNSTSACYVAYSVDGREYSMTRYSLDIHDKEAVKLIVVADCEYRNI